MTGKTHRAGGMLVSIIGFAILRERQLLLPNVNECLQWMVMYPFTMWGSVASDLDHHWDSCPEKDVPSRLVNMALHITKPLKTTFDKSLSEAQKKQNPVYGVVNAFCASHRSWQTHSDLTLDIMIYLLYRVLNGNIGDINASILALILTGLILGVVAHFILDSLTPDGIWIMGLVLLSKLLPKMKIPQKLHFVPHTKFFATGGKWELLIQKLLRVATWLAFIWLLGVFFGRYLPFDINIY